MERRGQSLAGCRVLVVEDENLIAKELAQFLRDNGAKIVGPVGRLEQAEEHASRSVLDVAILDINLQDEMAYTVAAELRRRNTPFISTTGYITSVIPAAFADVPLLEKPCNLVALVRLLAELCASTHQVLQSV